MDWFGNKFAGNQGILPSNKLFFLRQIPVTHGWTDLLTPLIVRRLVYME
jgi:hypothetical protein